MKNTIKRGYNWILSWVPSMLPNTEATWTPWADSVLALGDWPSNPSTNQALAVMIMHLGPTTVRKAKRFFYLSMRKSSSNQLAYSIVELARTEHKAEGLKQVPGNE